MMEENPGGILLSNDWTQYILHVLSEPDRHTLFTNLQWAQIWIRRINYVAMQQKDN